MSEDNFLLETFDILAKLESSEEYQTPASQNILFSKRRSIEKLKQIARLCSEYSSKELDKDFKFEIDIEQRQFEDWTENLSNGFIEVGFRLFKENFYLLAPLEVLHETAVAVLGVQENSILLEPNPEDSTAFNFFLAKFLCEESSLSKQRIYLCSSETYQSKTAINDHGQAIAELIENKEQNLLCATLSIEGSEFPVAFTLCPALCKRLEAYGNLTLQKDRRFKLIDKARLSWKVNLVTELSALNSIGNMRAGQFIELFSPTGTKVSLLPEAEGVPTLSGTLNKESHPKNLVMSIK